LKIKKDRLRILLSEVFDVAVIMSHNYSNKKSLSKAKNEYIDELIEEIRDEEK